MSKATNGKGDSPRNCFSQKFRDNYDAIFGKKKMKKDQIQELEKRVDGIERKIDDEIKFLRDYNTINFFMKDIRQEIRDLKTLLESK